MKKNIVMIQAAALLLITAAGCGVVPIEYDDTMLDSPGIQDTSFTDSTFRLSTHPDLASFDRDRPVIVCAHGYTASTYEWQEFREYAAADGRAYTSLVLLGGHGRTIEEFDGTTWKEWQKPIMAEYDELVKSGFTRISLAGSSTGGTLLLEYLSSDAFREKQKPREIFFIDPIVVPSSKLLHIVSLVGPMVGNSPQEFTNDLQRRHWYNNRPSSTLAELNELIERMRGKLEKGFSLPSGVKAKCYKVTTDDSADPISALLIYKGLSEANGNHIDVEMIDSDYHVFTQLAARDNATHADTLNQQRVFREMIDRVVAH